MLSNDFKLHWRFIIKTYMGMITQSGPHGRQSYQKPINNAYSIYCVNLLLFSVLCLSLSNVFEFILYIKFYLLFSLKNYTGMQN